MSDRHLLCEMSNESLALPSRTKPHQLSQIIRSSSRTNDFIPVYSIFRSTILITVLILSALTVSLKIYDNMLPSTQIYSTPFLPPKIPPSTSYSHSKLLSSTQRHFIDDIDWVDDEDMVIINPVNDRSSPDLSPSLSFQSPIASASSATDLPGMLNAINTDAINRLAAQMLPDILYNIKTSPVVPIKDGKMVYFIHIPVLEMSSFELHTNNSNNILELSVNNITLATSIHIQYRGLFVKYAMDVEGNFNDVNISIAMGLNNVNNRFSFTFSTITVTAKKIDLVIKNHPFASFMNWMKRTFLGDITQTVLKMIHDGLYSAMLSIKANVNKSLPHVANLGQFNAGIDLSLVNEIQFVSTSHNNIDIAHDLVHLCNVTDAATIVVGFNGETVDLTTFRPLSDNIPRHNISIPTVDLYRRNITQYIDGNSGNIVRYNHQNTSSCNGKNLFTIVLDDFVFNSYYDAWYNRGMQKQSLEYQQYLKSTPLLTFKNEKHLNELKHYFTTYYDKKHSNITNTNERYVIGLYQVGYLDFHPQSHDINSTVHDIVADQLLSTIHDHILKNLTTLPSDTLTNLLKLKAPASNNSTIIIEVSITQRPELHIANNMFSVITHSEQRYVYYDPSSSTQPYQLLFIIATKTTTACSLTVQYDDTLQQYMLVPFILEISSVFKQTYSLIGPLTLDLLNIVLQSVTKSALIPLMNQQLMYGVNLATPSMLILVEPKIALFDDFISIQAGLEYRSPVTPT